MAPGSQPPPDALDQQHVLHHHPPHQSSSLSPPPPRLPISPNFNANSSSFIKEPIEQQQEDSFEHYPLLDKLDLHHLQDHHHDQQQLHSSPVDSSLNSRSIDSESSISSSQPGIPTSSSSDKTYPHSPPQPAFVPKHKLSRSSPSSATITKNNSEPNHTPLPGRQLTPPSHRATHADQTTHINTCTPPSRSLSNPIAAKTSHRVYPIKSLVKVKPTPTSTPFSSPVSASKPSHVRYPSKQSFSFPPNKQPSPTSTPSSPPSQPPPASTQTERSTLLNQSTTSSSSSSSSSTNQRVRSNDSNSSAISNRSRRHDCLPPIAERTSSNGSEQSQYQEKMGIGRVRKSSTTRFFLPSNQDSTPTPHNNKSHSSRQMPASGTSKHHQAPASMLMNLSGLTDFDPTALASLASTAPHSARSNGSRPDSIPEETNHQVPLLDFINYPREAADDNSPIAGFPAHSTDSPPFSSMYPSPEGQQKSPLGSMPQSSYPSPASHQNLTHDSMPLSGYPSPVGNQKSSPGSMLQASYPSPASHHILSHSSMPPSSYPSPASHQKLSPSQFHGPALKGSKRSGVESQSTPNNRSRVSLGPPTIEKPVSVAGRSHAAGSVARKSMASERSQASSLPTITSDPDSYMTTRFEYQQGDDGLLILTGRKGEFTACEDEPIRIPGAIQAFGVLIAVVVHGESKPTTIPPKFEYDPNDPANGIFPSPSTVDSDSDSEEEQEEIVNISRLEIVQVSENSRHILGLSPKLLLNLYSFTEVLTQDQSQQLCDNLEVCLDRSSTSTAGPHTFRMSGRGGIGTGTEGPYSHAEWSCWCAAHRPDPITRPRLVVIEFELENDELNPPTTVSAEPVDEDDRGGVAGKPYEPTEQDLIESTMSINKPLRALARLRRKGKDFSGDSVEVLSILSQLNNQFDKAEDMPTFLKMAVGLVRELTGFDRVMIYKFDESWNGQVVAELVDWKRTRDLYRGLRFPASDIPAQARELYKINKVRMLYDRDQPTARLMCKTKEELAKPLNMTHCHLRAMSPIHIKYLANMGVRSSFSISIIMNDELWGLISCHSYGRFGQRVTFPTRHFCTMLGDTVSRNILRLNLSQRLKSRKLINTTSTSKNPSGYIVAKAEDLLWLFDAQSGVLSIGEEAKILGSVANSQEILAILEYLRVRAFDTIQVSTDINQTFPDIEYPGGFESISGVLVIPLSRSGQDFICFFRPAQSKEIHWAGNPHEKVFKNDDLSHHLEPRKSFKIWSDIVKERSKAWTDEQLETGSVLSLVYGKFIDVWRQKEAAVQNNQLQALLLSNASHEVRTPLHQILSTLELALDGQLDEDTRDNLSKSYSASRALVHVINDLLDLTKAEQGGDLFSRDPFDLPSTLEEAVSIHQHEAERKGIAFEMVENPLGSPRILQGDRARLRQVVSNLVGNAVKHTTEGLVHVQWGFEEQEGITQQTAEGQALMCEDTVRISVAVTDTGKGIPEAQLENIFRAFEQVGSGESQSDRMCESIGLGLAVVGRVVHNMGGQLRVDSTVNQGSKFTITLPFVVPKNSSSSRSPTVRYSDESGGFKSISSHSSRIGKAVQSSSSRGSHGSSHGSLGTSSSGIDGIVDAIAGGGSAPNSADPHYSPRLASSFRKKSTGPRKSISFESSAEGSGSAHSLGSNIGAQVARKRIGSVSNQSSPYRIISPSDHHKESQRLLSTQASLQKSINDRPSVIPEESIQSEDYISSKEAAKPEPVETPTKFSYKFKMSQKKLPSPQSPRPERPGVHPITDPGQQLEQSTLTPDHPRHLDGKVKKKTISPAHSPALINPVQNKSDYQKPDRNQPVAKQPMKVMVVEDDPINRLILKKKLTISGHSVSLTVHGQEAIELFERDPSKFDIILMDLQMPICDGVQATRKIREFEKTALDLSSKSDGNESTDSKNIDEDEQTIGLLPKTHLINSGVPIIAVSASLHEQQRQDIFEAGMDGWILKPVDFTRLATLMIASLDLTTRAGLIYKPGTWDQGGWLCLPNESARNLERDL
ncbi:hypothetical protein MJO29_012714 [Puccinia striiformis f. sp. tritici]|nr:hypothetical protein MJO29_012714 [Puccinia striiformis f. sp. tritici]